MTGTEIHSEKIKTLELEVNQIEVENCNGKNIKSENIESEKLITKNLENENMFSNNFSFNNGNGHTLNIANKINCSYIKCSRKDLIRTRSCKASKQGIYSICFQNEKINYLCDYIEYKNDSQQGDSMNILVNGVYSINACFQNTTFSTTSWIDKNNSGEIDINNSSEGNILTWSPKTNNHDTNVSWIGYLEKGDVIRIKSTVPSNISTSINGTINVNLIYEC